MNLESRKTKDLGELADILKTAEAEDRQKEGVRAMEEVQARAREEAEKDKAAENVQIDVSGVEPEVTQEFEKSQEQHGGYRWENGDGKTFQPLLKQIDRIALEELTKAQIKKYAEEIAKGNYPSKAGSIKFFNEHEQEIDREVQIIKAKDKEANLKETISNNFPNSEKPSGATEKKSSGVGRMRFDGTDPYGLRINKQIRYSKSPENSAKSAETTESAFARWDGKQERIHLEPGSQVRAGSIEAEREPVGRPESFKLDTKPEGLPKEAPRFGEVESHARAGGKTIISEKAPAAPTAAPEKPNGKERVEKPVIERTEAPKPNPASERLQTPAAAFEGRTETKSESNKELDGLVQFNLGKFGIINGNDTEEAKGLKMAELRREIPEFFALSSAQQLYALEKLSQKKSHNLDVETKRAIKDADATNKKGGIFGRIGRGLTRTGRTATLRKKTLEEMKKGGLASYKEDLQGIAGFTLARGKQIEVGEKGMVIKFVNRGEEVEGKHGKIIDAYNRAATALAETPYVHTTGDLTPLEIVARNKFKKAEKAFEAARAELMAFEGKGLPPEEMKKKVLEFSNLDDDIRLNQAYSYDSKDLYGDTSIWNKMGQIANDYKITEKGGYALSGFAARTMGKYALGLGGGVVASSFMGGLRGWISKRQEFKELAERKRSGDDVKGKEAVGVKEVIDGASYAAKIDKLIAEIENAKSPKRDALIQSLQNRVMIARERDEMGLVNFGKANKELAAKYDFFRALKAANRILLETDPEVMKTADAVAERMQSLYFKDEIKDVEKKKAIKASIKRGAIAGAGFFVGGFIANDLAFHNGEWTKGAIKDVSDLSEKALGELKEFAKEANAAANVQFAKLGRLGLDAIDGNSAMNPEATGINKPSFHKVEVMPEIPRLEQTFSMVGGRGAIGAIDELQEKLLARYGENMPENLKAFMAAKPEKLAIDWGFYRPGEEAESAAVMKGAKFGITNEGQITFEDHEGNVVRLGGGEKFAGRMYDGSPKAAAAIVDETPRVDFADIEAQHQATGWEHQNAGTGEIFSREVPMQPGMGGANAELMASTSGGPVGAETIGTISGVPPEGMSVATPEIRGTVVAKYDDFGRVTRMAWAPQSRIDEVVKFKATPDKFLVDDLEHSGLKYPTRSFGTSELRNTEMTKYCISYLEWRNMLKSGGFQPGSPEYNYITGQMRLVGSAIEAKSGAIFRPIQEDGILRGLKAPRIENIPTAPASPMPPEPEMPSAKAPAPVEDFTGRPGSSEVLKFQDGNGVKAKLEFLKDENGKIYGIGKESGMKTPFDNNSEKFLEDNWKDLAKAEAEAKGKDLRIFEKQIELRAKNYVQYETLIKSSFFKDLPPDGQEVIKQELAKIVSRYDKFLKNEQYADIAASIKGRS